MVLPPVKPFRDEIADADAAGITPPRLTHQTKPRYPKAPYAAWIQGTVGLEAVVEADGTVGEVAVIASLHPDLDAAAMACVRQWRFRPATRDGTPVPVVLKFEISFRRTA
jgi:protein TonB